MRVAFVLSGGGSLGAIQVGMLGALYERAIVPDLIVATSVGAFNGAFIASRPQSTTTAAELAIGLLGFLGHRNSMMPSSGLRRLLDEHVEFSRLEDAAIPLHVIAVEVLTVFFGEQEARRSERALQVRASKPEVHGEKLESTRR